MKTRLAICLVLAAATSALAPLPASAQAPVQPLPSAPAALPPHEIITSVRSMGLEPISRPVQRGRRYVLRAVDRRGAEVTVAADALSGRVLAVRPRGYREGPVFADRAYPRVYPEDAVPPRGNYQRQGSYEPPDNYQQPGNYVRPPARIPQEPSVIYAPRDNANPQGANPQPPAYRAPVAAKPPVPKVAAKPPAAPAEAAKTEQPADSITTGTATASPAPAADKPPESKVAAKPPAPAAAPVEAAKNQPPSDVKTAAPSSPPVAEKNPALTAPPVQAFD